MKKPFWPELPAIISNHGNKVKFKVLKEYCVTNNVSIPFMIRQHRIGGVVDLEGLQKAGSEAMGQSLEPPPPPDPEKSDEELLEDINSRFASLDLFTYGVVNGEFRSLIVSGNPGIGKTYNLEYILEAAAAEEKIQFTSVRGYVRPTGLYRLLWEHRYKNQVIMFDDADSVFADEIGLNLLKGALDTTKKRTISWRSEKKWETSDGEEIPSYFDFNGSAIFVSNINFQRAIQGGSKVAPHLEALMSRSFYLDLNMTNVRELMIRIESVVAHSDILSSMNIARKNQNLIVDYIRNNMGKLREMSLRTVLKLGTIWIASGSSQENFKKMADATTLRR